MSARRTDHTPLLIGLGLVAAGMVLLVERAVGDGNADLKDTLVFAGLAALLVVALIATRGYGFLIAAMLFAGLSAAKYAVILGEDSGGAVLLGPGIALLAAYAVGVVALGRTPWWPLVPGSILTLLGALVVFGGRPGAELAGRIWPIVLVGIGVLVFAAFRNARRVSETRP